MTSRDFRGLYLVLILLSIIGAGIKKIPRSTQTKIFFLNTDDTRDQKIYQSLASIPGGLDEESEEADLGLSSSHYMNPNPFVDDVPTTTPPPPPLAASPPPSPHLPLPPPPSPLRGVDMASDGGVNQQVDEFALHHLPHDGSIAPPRPPPPTASPPPSPQIPLSPPPSPLRGVDRASGMGENQQVDEFALHHLPHDRSIAPPRPPPPPFNVRGVRGGVSGVDQRSDNVDAFSLHRIPRGRSNAPRRPPPPSNASDAVDGHVGDRNPVVRRSSAPSRPSPPRVNATNGRVHVNASSLSRDGPGLPMHVAFFNGQNAQVRVAFPHLPELEGLRDEDSF